MAKRLAPLHDLPSQAAWLDTLVIEGFTCLERLLAHGHAVEVALATPASAARVEALLPAGTPLAIMATSAVRDFTGYGFHRGVLALAPRPRYRPPARLRTLVIAERLADPANLGALIRNACALGADALWTSTDGADPFSRRAIRTAMGLGFRLPIWSGSLLPELQTLQQKFPTLRLIATQASVEAQSLATFAWPAHCILAVGNEGDGLSPALAQAAHCSVRIEMQPGVDSLNVAAASAILLYHRQASLGDAVGV